MDPGSLRFLYGITPGEVRLVRAGQMLPIARKSRKERIEQRTCLCEAESIVGCWKGDRESYYGQEEQ